MNKLDGEAEVSAYRLPNLLAIERSSQGITEEVGDCAIIFVSNVKGAYKPESVQSGGKEKANPVRGDAP